MDRLDPHLPAGPTVRRWRRLDRLTILVFVLSLPMPAVLMAVGVRSGPIENRPLHEAREISVAGLGDPAWYGALDKAISDRVPFRRQAVGLRARVVMGLGGSPNPAVVRGTGDWLFTIEELDPTCTFGAEQITAQLDAARSAFEAAGQRFSFVLAPDKHAVYPERRRADDGIGIPCTDLERPAMAASLDARDTWTVNGWSALARARDASGPDTPLFFGQDSHWTPTGAIPTIRALITSIDPGLWSDDDVASGGSKEYGMELARQVGIPSRERVAEPTIRPGMTVERTELPIPVDIQNARAVYRYTASGDRPTVPGRTVIVYDSFYGQNMERIAPFFAESTWIHQGDLLNHPELAALSGPFDRVILERVERGLYLGDLAALLRPLVRDASGTPAP